jgi:hypothetical protein
VKKRDRKALAKYVRWVANEMELRDWELTVEFATDPDYLGHCVCSKSQHHASISVADNFRDHSAEEQRETIVHELLHIHLEVPWRMVQTDLAEPLGKVSYYIFCDSYRRALEYAIDGMSKALAKHLPLIDWPE